MKRQLHQLGSPIHCRGSIGEFRRDPSVGQSSPSCVRGDVRVEQTFLDLASMDSYSAKPSLRRDVVALAGWTRMEKKHGVKKFLVALVRDARDEKYPTSVFSRGLLQTSLRPAVLTIRH